jgi:hypothetical protein
VIRAYIERYGRPFAFYTDKFSVFRVNLQGKEDRETQCGRALRQLGIELICANSPQAKGRVERVNGTLQDRLVKEMRLRGISDKETANAYLPEFIEDYNRRFSVEPKDTRDRHRRELPEPEVLDLIFSIQDKRTLSKNLEMSYENVIYQIQVEGKGYRLQHAKITVCENLSGAVTLLYRGVPLDYKCYNKHKRAPAIVDTKGLNTQLDRVTRSASVQPVRAEHPWRRFVINPAKGAVR